MNVPLVSIIIPTFNRANLIEKTLKSLDNQIYPNIEIIVIDDGSQDRTREIVLGFSAKYKQITYKKRPENLPKGPGSCRNYGVSISVGEYIQFFDDDDVAHPEMISRKMKAILLNNSDVSVSKLNIIEHVNNSNIQQNTIYSTNLISDYFQHKIAWFVCGPLWKKTCLNEKFDTEIIMFDDWDFNIRNLYHDPKIEYIDEALVDYIKRVNNSITTIQNELKINSEFSATKKQYYLLKKNKLCHTPERTYYLKRLVSLLKISLVNKFSESKKIYIEILRNFNLKEWLIFLRITIGFFSYRLFNKGYRLIFYKE